MHPTKVSVVKAAIIHQAYIQLVYLMIRRKKRSRLALTDQSTAQKKEVTAKLIFIMAAYWSRTSG